MSNIEEFINELDLSVDGEMHDRSYIVDFDNDREFSRVYNQISTDDDFNVDENSKATTDELKFVFYNDYFEITFTADFIGNNYRMVVTNK